MRSGAIELARRLMTATLLSALVAGCAGGGDKRRPSRIAKSAPKAKPRPVMPNDAAFRQCAAGLNAAAVRFTPLPNESRGAGCTLYGTVKLLDYGTPTTNLGPITCPVAARFTAWVRYGVLPAARLLLKSEVVKVETFGTYACRNIVGNPSMAGKRSEHAHANAIDISAFILADGRRITVEKDWAAGSPGAEFLRRVHQSACKRFDTVLGPNYNAAHYNHFHFDMGGRAGTCR
ncbi:MAG: extensin family protein [Sphingobium sp.]